MPSLAKRRLVIAEDEVESMSETRPEELRLLEALLFASAEPLDEKTLAARLPQGVDVKEALKSLQADYATRGIVGLQRFQRFFDVDPLRHSRRQCLFVKRLRGRK